MKARFLLVLWVLSGLSAACTEAVPQDKPAYILAMGDSLMSWHGESDASVSDAMENILGEQVIDRSVPGARIFYNLPISGAMGLNISKQYRPGAWKWVVLNGGGNDLWFGCGCWRCDRRMTRMITPDGSDGSIPQLVSRIRETGARVIYVGYLRSPGVNSAIEHCRDEGDEFDKRLERMAARDDGVYFVSLADLVPYGDRSYHWVDMIHPSTKASRAIAERIAAIIR
jgi:lysophospholipase L1-like esterase